MPAMPGRNESGCVAVLVALALLLLAGGAWFFLTAVKETDGPAGPGEEPGITPAPAPPVLPVGRPAPASKRAVPVDPTKIHPSLVASVAAVRAAAGAVVPPADPVLHRALARAYDRKLADPAYAAARRVPGISRDPDRLPFEDEVKAARARLAAAATAPPGVEPLSIPVLAAGAVRVDGILLAAEWDAALEVDLGPGARLFLGHDGEHLLLGAEAHEDRTEAGYDQFRLFLHTGLSRTIVNERVHLSGRGIPNAIRETSLRWTGAPGAGPGEDWKEHSLSDWNVLERCVGASTVEGFRRYELSVDLAEAGIPADAPFPVRVEIEGDPRIENGKFRGRVILATLGTEDAPLWFALE